MHIIELEPSLSSRQKKLTALIAYGGGKDSSYVLAVGRYIQLYLREFHQRQLDLRVVTNRHAGMPQAVMNNIDRVYRALSLYSDPSAELLLIDGDKIRPFAPGVPVPPSMTEASRTTILMTGHRCYGDGRPTFCNACNSEMMAAMAKGIAFKDGVDLVLTGDSRPEQAAYRRWIRKLGRKLSLPSPETNDFAGLVELTGDISKLYFADIFGSDSLESSPTRSNRTGGPSRASGNPLLFFSVYEDNEYRADSHWSFLTEYLGFQFDELAFSFTESDCANPALMAHLRGLRAERVFGTSYAVGVSQYVEFATALMHKKEFPDSLIELMRKRYSGLAAMERMRRLAEGYAFAAYRLDPCHLVCMVFSPFASRGRHLDHYLSSEVPDLFSSAFEVRSLLSSGVDAAEDSSPLAQRVENVCGLKIRSLRHLYSSDLVTPDPEVPISPTTAIGRVLVDDPHKAVVLTRDSVRGKVFFDHISGR